VQVVLEGCSGKEKAVSRIELPETLGDLTFLVFDLVGLIHDDILPLELEALGHGETNALESR